jgi:flagellar basal body-associated protein FliL
MDEEQIQEPEHTPKRKGGALKKILVIGFVLMLAGAGGAWWMLGGGAAEAAAEEAGLETRGLVPFEPFLVNLADAGGHRFLKATIQLVMESPAEAEHVEKTPVVHMAVRSAILELLTQQSAPALVTAEGKQALKAAIQARVSGSLKGQKVVDVLFSEFVVQF